MARNAGTSAQDGMDQLLRYINITLIDTTGQPTTTQIMAKEFNTARDFLRNRVTDMAMRAVVNRWDRPVIAAYIYDTATETLHRYIVTNHDITLPMIEEVL